MCEKQHTFQVLRSVNNSPQQEPPHLSNLFHMLLGESDTKYVSTSAVTAMPHFVLGSLASTDTIAMDRRTITENAIY